MEKLVSLKAVQDAINTLEARGDRVSQRKVREVMGGGSPNLINQYFREIQAGAEAGVKVATDLPAGLSRALISEINAQVQAATESLASKLDSAVREASDAIEDLEAAQSEIQALKAALEDLQQQQRVEAAEAARIIERLNVEREQREIQVQDLQRERQQLIESGEVARTEAAKAQLQVERADQAAAKAEARISVLEEESKELGKHNRELEKNVAVAQAQLAAADDKFNNVSAAKADCEKQLDKAQDKIEVLHGRIEGLLGQLAEKKPPVEQGEV